MAFISLLDDRARPKGSRDPLGFEMVWTFFGRKVVGNLTTITSSWRIFSVGLLGFYWCNQLCRDTHPLSKQRVLQEHFIRYEQLAAYLRHISGDDEVMGIKRVRRRWAEAGKTLSIGTKPQDLILSDQVSYGIWGLYSTALRETGLVKGENRELTEQGLDIAQRIETNLFRNGEGQGRDWYWRYLQGDKTVKTEELKSEGKRFVKAITQVGVMDALIKALLLGSGKHHCQMALYEACRVVDAQILENESLSGLIAVISKHASADLSQVLSNIHQIERLLVTANILFDYCRRKDGERLRDVAVAIQKVYSFDYLPEGPELAGCPYASDLEKLRSCLRRNEVVDALRCLLEMNKKIMTGRGGAAWVEEAGNERLRVRVNAEKAKLPPPEVLQTQWHYDYFLRSYAHIAAMERRR